MAARIAGVFDEMPKWKVALIVGAPVAIGAAGLWYMTRGTKLDKKSVDSTTVKPPIEPTLQVKKSSLIFFMFCSLTPGGTSG